MSFLRRLLLGVSIWSTLVGFCVAASAPETAFDSSALTVLGRRRGLSLPEWGPYSTRYVGISHLADPAHGTRFDLSIMPGFYHSRLDLPDVLRDSRYHPWETSSDLKFFSFRHELEWKDRVYVEVSYSWVDDHTRLIRVECVNHAELSQDLMIEFMASLNFSSVSAGDVALPPDAVWVPAVPCDDLVYTAEEPKHVAYAGWLHDTFGPPLPRQYRLNELLPYDGWWRGEERVSGAVDGGVLGQGFGARAGDRARWPVHLPARRPGALRVVVLRYRLAGNRPARFHADGILSGDVIFPPSDGFATLTLPVSGSGFPAELALVAADGGVPLQLNGFAIVDRSAAGGVKFSEVPRDPVPAIEPGGDAHSIVLDYPGLGHCYGLGWDYDRAEVREVDADELESISPDLVNNHVSRRFRGPGTGHFTDVHLRNIVVPPQGRRVIYGIVCDGDRAAVTGTLRRFRAQPAEREETFARAHRCAIRTTGTTAGERFRFSQDRLAATVLGNVIYPVYTQGAWNLADAGGGGGRAWSSLYTWDAGFDGIGLAHLNLARATGVLNTYLTEPGSRQAAFIHHGTPLPTQILLYRELWDRTLSLPLLTFFYPRVRQAYEFLAGRAGGSTTLLPGSGLLRTWDYFYNSGGWDDYPAQLEVHRRGLEPVAAPAVTTAVMIRCARILRQAAQMVNRPGDLAAYDRDIETWGRALRRYSWDEASGYFAYVLHDARGRPDGILRSADGGNADRGLDGVTPLIAGVCDPHQVRLLLAHLASPAELWSGVGISTVDQSAPYFRPDGYWNGSVWMPYQWLLWKTMLDLGEADAAARIATTALEVIAREAGATYNCFEFFNIASGRGLGWRQFGGLSSPLLAWYAAYYHPGNLTGGFDCWIERRTWNADCTRLSARLLNLNPGSAAHGTIIACLAEGGRYAATVNGRPAAVRARLPGVLEVDLPASAREIELDIHPQ